MNASAASPSWLSLAGLQGFPPMSSGRAVTHDGAGPAAVPWYKRPAKAGHIPCPAQSRKPMTRGGRDGRAGQDLATDVMVSGSAWMFPARGPVQGPFPAAIGPRWTCETSDLRERE